ncbi:hypothetical protein NN561_011615 [Cricetulus griseus]
MSVPQNSTSKLNGKSAGFRDYPRRLREKRAPGAGAPSEEQSAYAHSQVPCPVTLPALLSLPLARRPLGLRTLRTSARSQLSSQAHGALPVRSNSRAPLETNAAAF